MKSIAFTILLLFSINSFSFAQFPTYTFTNTGIDKGYFLFTPTDQNGMTPSNHYFAIMDYTGHLIYYFNVQAIKQKQNNFYRTQLQTLLLLFEKCMPPILDLVVTEEMPSFSRMEM